MATLADLKARIVEETNRDDLQDEAASVLTRVIQDAIEMYAAEPWWWNKARVQTNCVIGNEYVDRPAGARIIDKPFLVVGNVRYDMTKQSMETIEALYTTPISGQPTDYCEFVTQVRLWPTPNQTYPIIWLDTADVTPLDYGDDASSNYWTNQGAPLIAAQAKILLYRDYLSAEASDPRLALAVNQEASWYNRLKGETNRRIGTGRVRPSW